MKIDERIRQLKKWSLTAKEPFRNSGIELNERETLIASIGALAVASLYSPDGGLMEALMIELLECIRQGTEAEWISRTTEI